MDGVLVDSEPFIAEAAIEMFDRRYGVKVKEEDFQPFIGAGEDRYIGGVAEKYGVEILMPEDKDWTYKIYGEIIRGRLEELPGAGDFIDFCRKKGLKTALATSADKVKMEANLNEIGIPLSSFDAAVNGLEVEKKKPYPDIYLQAAELIQTPTSRCLVVEDAINGVIAAKKAGAFCLGLTSGFSGEELKEAGADFLAVNLKEFDHNLLFKRECFETGE